ncbi:MAG: NAD(P)-dependent oxidoreductase [Candidatus Omnitrophica bacterium]|nr:NAD(P)-dependent oxidoreductase [Candidatus Omnitrophota bacterium]
MKILLTGAAGMLAAEVIPVLSKQGHTVYQTDINRRLPDIEALLNRDVLNRDVTHLIR